MDPASVVGLIAAIQQILTSIFSIGQGVREAKDEMNKLCSELFALKAALEHVQLTISPTNPAPNDDNGDVKKALNSSSLGTPEFKNMISLTQEVLQELLHTVDKKPNKLKDPLRRLAWPFKKPDVDRYVARLERSKSWFILAVTTDNNVVCRESYRAIQSIERRIELRENREIQHQSVEMRRAVETWLAPHNYIAPFEKALRLYQPGTGGWYLDGMFQKWVEGHGQPIIWLLAKCVAGAGKTTLLSAAVRRAQMLRVCNSDVNIAYGFCSFTDQDSQNAKNIFGCFLVQICLQNPDLWSFVDDKYNAQKTQPKYEVPKLELWDLIEVLLKCLRLSARTLLFLDAINESKDSASIIQILQEIIKATDSVIAMVSSTEDLGVSIQSAPVSFVTMKGGETMSDMRLYIDTQLESNGGLRNLSSTLKAEIKSVIQHKATGSFRYVQCQLEALSHQKTARDVRSALHHIPGTLEKTYQNILARIPVEDAPIAKRALLWISFSLRPMKFRELCEAVVIPEEGCLVDDEMRLLRPDTLLRICGSLITFDTISTQLSLAHSTVWDYLTSQRIKSSDVREFYLDESAADNTITRYSLNYILNPAFRPGYCASHASFSRRLDDWPLLPYVAETLYHYFEYIILDGPMKELLKRFFNTHTLPRGGNYSSWVQAFQLNVWFEDLDVSNPDCIESSTPLYYAARAGLLPILRIILEVEGTKNLETPGGMLGSTALHVAAWQGHEEIVKELLRLGANARESNEGGLNGLYWAVKGGYRSIEMMLRQAGAEMPSEEAMAHVW